MDIKKIITITTILLNGCTSETVINKQQHDTAVVSRPPPNWPPHEHTAPRWPVQAQLLNAGGDDNHWNHTTFEQDPTSLEIQ